VPNFPGAVSTIPTAFNDNGVVVGIYMNPGDCCGIDHGFIYRNGSFVPLNCRKMVNSNTELTGISNNSVIVGDHFGNAFLYSNGVFKDIVGPNGQQVTVRNISAGGIITGDTSVPGSVGPHGFTPTCSVNFSPIVLHRKNGGRVGHPGEAVTHRWADWAPCLPEEVGESEQRIMVGSQ